MSTATTQPEALRLADVLEVRGFLGTTASHAAIELRRLHELNQELLEALQRCEAVMRLEPSRGEAYEAARVAISKATGDAA